MVQNVFFAKMKLSDPIVETFTLMELPVLPTPTSHLDKPSVEEIFPGITVERLHDGQIWVGTIIATKHNEVMFKWHQWIIATIDQWPAEMPLLLLIDPSKNPVWTPQMREQTDELRRKAESRLIGRVAVVIPAPSVIIPIINMFLRSGKQKIPTRLFDTRENALAWLESYLTDPRQR